MVLSKLITQDRTRCGLLAKAISDEEEAADFYRELTPLLYGRENISVVDEIIIDEQEHKQKFKSLYKAMCIALQGESEVEKESW